MREVPSELVSPGAPGVGRTSGASTTRGRIAFDVIVAVFLVWVAVSMLVPRTIPRFVFLPKPAAVPCEEGRAEYEPQGVWWTVHC